MATKKKILKTTLTFEKEVDGKIELEEKTFMVPRVSARATRELMELEADGSIYMSTAEDVDRLVAFIVGTLFRNQFSVDDFYDGVDADEFDERIYIIMMQVRGLTESEAKKEFAKIKNTNEKNEEIPVEEEEKN